MHAGTPAGRGRPVLCLVRTRHVAGQGVTIGPPGAVLLTSGARWFASADPPALADDGQITDLDAESRPMHEIAGNHVRRAGAAAALKARAWLPVSDYLASGMLGPSDGVRQLARAVRDPVER